MHFFGLSSPSFGARAVTFGFVFVGLLCHFACAANAHVTEPSSREEPTDFGAEYSLLVAPVRGAMCCALAPNESWVAAGYGRWMHLGQVCVWDVATGKLRWRANEERGVRAIAASPDGALVASGNYGGHIRLRDAATGGIQGEFRESSGSVEHLAFSSDGQRLASCSNSRVIRLWETKTGKPLRALTGHTARVNWVEFSHDGKGLLTAAVDKTVRLWNVQDGRLQQIFNHPDEVSTAIFLPGQDQIATACSDGMIRVFSTANGQLITSMAGSALLPPAISYAVAASGDGRLIASNCGSSIHVWDAGTGQLRATLEGHGDVIFGLSISRDGKTLVSAGADSAVRIWSIPDEQSRHLLNLPDDDRATSGPVATLAISPDGKLLAVPTSDGTVQLRDRTTGALVRTLAGNAGEIVALAFSPSGQTLAAGTSGGTLHLWNVVDGKQADLRAGHAAAISSVAWSPTGNLIGTSSLDNTVRLWDPNKQKNVAVLEGHSDAVTGVAFLPGGTQIVSSSNDGTVRIWDVEKHTTARILANQHGPITAIAVSSDGTTIATAGEDTTIRLWDPATLTVRAELKGHQQPVTRLVFSPQGKSLASGGMGGGIMLWDVTRGIARRTLNGHTGAVTGVAFVPDGSALISSGADETIRVWKANVGLTAPLLSVPAHQKAYAVKFSRDGKWMASGGENKLVTLRDPATGATRSTLSGHNGLVFDVAFSPDSKRLASGSADGTVRVWSVEDGALLANYDAFGKRRSNVRSVIFSSDGSEIAAGCEDGTITIWNVAEEKIRLTLPAQELPVLCVRYSPDGSLLATTTGMNQKPNQPGELRLWQSDSGNPVAVLGEHASEIKRVVFDASGTRMASVGSNKSIIVWNVAQRSVETKIGAEFAPTAITFLSDENLLAVGDARGGVAIYAIDQGAVVYRYAGHMTLIPALAVRPDQQVIATASHDGTIKLWPVPATLNK